MTSTQIEQLEVLRIRADKAHTTYAKSLDKLREAQNACDHRDSSGRSALQLKSTHHPDTCGGYKECAVCAGEQKETFVDVCDICKRRVGTEVVTK